MFSVKLNDKKTVVMELLLAALVTGMSGTAQAVPSFGRQTGMECSACRTIFPQLTTFGREFKLGGYVIVSRLGQGAKAPDPTNCTLELMLGPLRLTQPTS